MAWVGGPRSTGSPSLQKQRDHLAWVSTCCWHLFPSGAWPSLAVQRQDLSPVVRPSVADVAKNQTRPVPRALGLQPPSGLVPTWLNKQGCRLRAWRVTRAGPSLECGQGSRRPPLCRVSIPRGLAPRGCSGWRQGVPR